MEKVLYEEMFRMEEKHWWFAGRRQIVLLLLKHYLGTLLPEIKHYKVCDIGTGCGINLTELIKEYESKGMDISEQAIKFCQRRGLDVAKGRLPDLIPFETDFFDAVLLLDVLEHVEDDQESVRNVKRIIKRNGIVIATVPAYPWLWTKRDEFHHHKRRYSKNPFIRLFQKEELLVILCSYFNSFLFLPAAAERISKRILRLNRYGPDLLLPASPVNKIFKNIFAFERRILPRFAFPFGLSLICIAQKVAAG